MERVGEVLGQVTEHDDMYGESLPTDFSLPVKYAADCEPCELCGEPWCEECGRHYSDCAHPGPHSEEEDPVG